MTLFELLKLEEGYSETVYRCSEGYPTIGIGTKIGTKGADLGKFTLTVNEQVAKALLDMRVNDKLKKLSAHTWFNKLDETRKIIILSMAYQMGVTGLLKFKMMIAALDKYDYKEAALQALDSRWAKQTPERANRHAEVLRTGKFESVAEYEV